MVIASISSCLAKYFDTICEEPAELANKYITTTVANAAPEDGDCMKALRTLPGFDFTFLRVSLFPYSLP